LVGNFRNNGREWRRQGTPELANVHDFIDPKLKRAVPYGVYDIANNTGWVRVGTDHDTATFAVNADRLDLHGVSVIGNPIWRRILPPSFAPDFEAKRAARKPPFLGAFAALRSRPARPIPREKSPS
jgi:hypothetical protein